MNNNYHIIRIQQYLRGELGKEEMHQLEREALDDPLLQDAIDGFRLQQSVSHRRLSLLQQRLAARIEGKEQERSAFFFGWQRLGVAATACVLMVALLLLFWIRNSQLQHPAMEKKVDVELMLPMQVHAEPAAGQGEEVATPDGGWTQYNAYLAGINDQSAAKGSVVLAFKVDTSGKPYAIKAVGDADERLVNLGKRLLIEGPVWKGYEGRVSLTFK